MGLYLFKYCVNVPDAEVKDIESIDIEERLRSTIYANRVFGIARHNYTITDNVFLIRDNNYKECIDAIREQKMFLESSVYSRGTFGSIGLNAYEEKYGAAKNKLHTVKCTNSLGLIDMII